MQDEARIMTAFVCLKIKHLWKRRCKRFGANAREVIHKRLKCILNFATQVQHKQKENKSKLILSDFLGSYIQNCTLRMKGTEFIKQISFMQLRIRDQLICRFGKVDVLINYWDKIVGHVQR